MGADLIAGHHPHVIQPCEKYRNGHIFYSLGNFMFDFSHSGVVSTGMVATVTIGKDREISCRYSGVRLSYKNTVEPLPGPKFEKYVSFVTKLYNDFVALEDEEYTKRYKSLLKWNHLTQRILMKTSIISEFLRINKEDKLSLVKNLRDYYFS
jgi:poly-gamma-glutamate synthesis protein (capsule biosynthesis protein)